METPKTTVELTNNQAAFIISSLSNTTLAELINAKMIGVVSQLVEFACDNADKTVWVAMPTTMSSTSLNQKIRAIKAVRMLTGCGLKEAKDYVDQQFEQHGNSSDWIGPVPCDYNERICGVIAKANSELGAGTVCVRPS